MLRRTLLSSALALGALPIGHPGAASALPTRTINGGGVMVSVTPLALSANAAVWRFEVRINTHVTPLGEDMAAVATLDDGAGHAAPPPAWDGDPPGGHHRRGVLAFQAIEPAPASVTLRIRGVGGIAERAFTWAMPG